MTKERTMAACGLICSTCPMHLAPKYPEIAQKLTEDFKGRWENVKPEDFAAKGVGVRIMKCGAQVVRFANVVLKIKI